MLDYLFKIYYRLPKLFFYFKPEHEVPDLGPLSRGLSDIQKKELQYRKFREDQQQALLRYILSHLIETAIACTNEALRQEGEESVISGKDYAKLVYRGIMKVAAVSNSVQFVIRRFDLFELYGLLP